LEDANLKDVQQSELEQELETLTHAEEIKLNLSKVLFALSGGDQNILSSLNEVKGILSSLSKFNKQIGELSSRLNSAYVEIKHIQ
jgi:DNA repair protein RecN (Recombination protein N)